MIAEILAVAFIVAAWTPVALRVRRDTDWATLRAQLFGDDRPGSGRDGGGA